MPQYAYSDKRLQKDAERILEKVMHRRNWSWEVCDQLKQALTQIVEREVKTARARTGQW